MKANKSGFLKEIIRIKDQLVKTVEKADLVAENLVEIILEDYPIDLHQIKIVKELTAKINYRKINNEHHHNSLIEVIIVGREILKKKRSKRRLTLIVEKFIYKLK